MPPTIEFDVWMVATMYWVKAIIYLVPLPDTILSYFQRIYAGEGIHTRQKTKKVKNVRNAKYLSSTILVQCSGPEITSSTLSGSILFLLSSFHNSSILCRRNSYFCIKFINYKHVLFFIFKHSVCCHTL